MRTVGIARSLLVCALLLDQGATRAAEPAPVFGPDIAPLLQRCQKCHRPGQIAPMPLRTYEEIQPFLGAIREAVRTRRMPPWLADPAFGDFVDDPSFTDEEIARIVAWIDAGAPRGERSQEPPPLTFSDAWTIGEPDLVLAMPSPVRVEAGVGDRFERVRIATGLTEDRWIRAVEIRPGDRTLVHHAIAYVLQHGERDPFWSRQLRKHGYLLSEYSAGNLGDIYPPGTGRLLEAGAELLLEVHYHPRGKGGEDRTRIALRFHDDPARVRHRVVTRALANYDLRIPAGESAHRHISETRLKRPYRLLSFQPHMHYRGKAMRLEAIGANDATETLAFVPRYDFLWQLTYTYRVPPLLPAGTTLRVVSTFDNSAANPRNPDPTVDVRWGPRAVDEMAIGWVDLIEERASPRPEPSTARGAREAARE